MFQFVPLEQWPGQRTKSPRRASFRAPWSQTLGLLTRELNHLQARQIVLQADVGRHQIKRDGMLYADATPRTPGVILAFGSKHGPLSYPADAFDRWQDNLRAIALALEALRAVDRYGVTKRAEQYRGWQALPAPNGDHFDKESAARFVLGILGWKPPYPPVIDWADVIRTAEKASHPDRGGNAADFNKVQQARKVLLA